MDEEFYVDPRGRSGGLALWWKLDVTVNIWYHSKNIIHMSLDSSTMAAPKYVTCVYGAPRIEDKMAVWNKMRSIGAKINDSWICSGDFNDVLSISEKVGRIPADIRRIMNFQCMLADCQLMDLDYHGAWYTWCNRRLGTDHIKERLDRAFGNTEFRMIFQKAAVLHIKPVGSDHHMLVIDCDYRYVKVPKLFRFEAVWAEHEDFLPIVRRGWRIREGIEGASVDDIVTRLKNCKKILLGWSKEAFPNAKKLIENLTLKLSVCNSGILDEARREEADSLLKLIEEAWEREEKYWWQRSRINWLSAGDRNTKFFHSCTIQRRVRNKVVKLKGEDGEWLEEEKDINDAFSKFYSELFASGGRRNMEETLVYVDKTVSEEDNKKIQKAVTMEEIKLAAFQLNGLKAPGPDGFSGCFYYAAWGEINGELVEMIKDFFDHKVSLQPINKTNIVLIPKVDVAEKVGQFRPIGLCNFVYKIISKVLANRLKPLLMRIISENQRAFVAERLIQDNIIVAQEAFHYLKNKKKGRKVEMAVKIDMNKAYDRLEWCFIEAVMRRMGFGETWIGWVMECVSSVSLDLMVGGRKIADLNMERGIRQGDPLSPYLFIIAADVLSKMVQWHVDNNRLRGIKLANQCPVLSHCFFADDAIFFINARKQNCRVLKKIFDAYCNASGQAINIDKSCVFFSKNADETQKKDVYDELGIKASTDPGKYLGLPLLWGRSKSKALAFVKNKLGSKLQGWKQKLVTFAGREILIKAVANAIPIFPMSCFSFPKNFCRELDSLISRFWWGQKDEEGRIHWKSWKSLSAPKMEGGLGFRDLELFNLALLAKTAWRILLNPEDFWCRILKGLYFPECDFLNAKKGNKASWCWSSILEGRELLKENLCWKINDGGSAKIFTDKWLPSVKGCKLRGRTLEDDKKDLYVKALIVNGKWDFTQVEGILSDEEKDWIKMIKLPGLNCADRLIWLRSRDGFYSVKMGYRVAKEKAEKMEKKDPTTSYKPSKSLWSGIWRIKMPPKVLHFIWRAINSALATKEALFRRKCSCSPMCDICQIHPESVEHMLFLCPWAQKCWFGSPLTLKFKEVGLSSFGRWLEEWLQMKECPGNDEIALFAGICWGIWKARCKFIFEKVEVDPWLCVAGAMRLVRDFSEATVRNRRRLTSSNIEERKEKWVRPVRGRIKLNIDAAFCHKSGRAAVGIVGRNEEGEFIGGLGKEVEVATPFMAESLALIEAYKCADFLQGKMVTVETDCAELFNRMKKGNVEGSEWQSIEVLKMCLMLQGSLMSWDLALVSRLGNKAADHLAANVMRGMVPHGWLSQPPSSLWLLLQLDLANSFADDMIREGCMFRAL
ncbi:uncharacterized protein LOC114740485 [Neltuma alba]|uniref:uncharacterized protein LOC114740485 n=1 Tax=Neltuma alba TaxID=207710 RepID=UPI0010A51CD4|nr:uncharacterized protein LOC114740485 [Prosopis alba]